MLTLNGYRILKYIPSRIYNSGMNALNVINSFLIGLKLHGREYILGTIKLVKGYSYGGHGPCGRIY